MARARDTKIVKPSCRPLQILDGETWASCSQILPEREREGISGFLFKAVFGLFE